MENKSTHIGSYSIKVVKYLSEIISPILCKIVNRSFEMGQFPKFFKTARVIPLYKTGEPNDVNNYRPISILPIFSKIFEKLVYKQIYGYLQINNFLSKNQYGFRKKMSTTDAVIDTTQFIFDSLDKGKTVVSFFLDFSKAFDCVNHAILLRKLEAYGIRGLAKDWFSSYLHNRNQYVVLNNATSLTKSIHYGVPQGSTLGPLLFLIFINDFPLCSSFFKFTLFADDSTLTCSFNHSNIELMKIELERELLKVDKWLSSNRIKLNANKSNFIIFSYRKNLRIDNIYFGDNLLNQVSTTKFLGIYVDEHLNFKYHIDQMLQKVSRSIGLLFKLKYFLPKNVLLTLYNSLILPYFNYGIVLWHNSPHISLNRVIVAQKRAVRAICQLGYNDHTNNYFKDLNILKIDDLYKLNLCAIRFSQIKNPANFSISDQFIRNSDIHSYPTRNRDLHSKSLYRRTSSESCFIYQASN